MKKLVAFLLFLITTAGTVIPCCGVDDCCADRPANTAGHDKHQSEGTCSPFFACATCPCSIELTKPIQLDIPVGEKIVHHAHIVQHDLPGYTSSSWQPPRSC